jgi:hypothetical protein
MEEIAGSQGIWRLAGRRPCDYWHFIPKARQNTVYARIWNAYGRAMPDLKKLGLLEDCTNEACFRLLKYPYDLRLGPEPISGEPSSEWYAKTESALVFFACAFKMRRRVAVDVYKKNRAAGDVQKKNLQRSGLDDQPSTHDPDWEIDETHAFGRQCEFIQALRTLASTKVNASVVQVLDVLMNMADSREPSGVEHDGFRGANSQFDNKLVLEALLRKHPDAGWDIKLVRKAMGDLRRYAKHLEEEVAREGVLLFGRARQSDSVAVQNQKKKDVS